MISWPDWLTPKAWRPAPVGVPEAAPLVEKAAGKPGVTPPAGDRFLRCLAIVLGHEGGFVNDPQDPGGATNLGITRETLASWRGRPVTEAEVRGLKRDEALAIYRERYWRPLRCDLLPAGHDLMGVDFGVNAGPRAGARMLQRAVGAVDDGIVGPATIAAAGAADRLAAIDRMAALRVEHYRGLATFGRFGRGWLRRTEEVRQAARRMAQE